MIGVAGCGRMGAPMLDALRDGGARALGFDVRPMSHPHVTDNIMGFAPRLDTVFCVLRDETQTDTLLFGTQNLIRTAPRLTRIFLCATLPPDYVRTLRGRVPAHITLIDAPLTGGPLAAENRVLGFRLGGAKADIDDAIPLLALMGTTFQHMGPYGTGMRGQAVTDSLTAAPANATGLRWTGQRAPVAI